MIGFLSLCYEYVLLLLVTKEAILASGLVELSKVGNWNRDTER